MRAILLLGFLIGMRHALEADHLAAVASLATGGKSVRRTVLQGAIWGLGHSIALFLIAGVCLLLNAAIPDRLMLAAEAAVGLMLLYFGGEILWRLRRQGVHLHAHRHGDGTVHLHAHAHPPAERHPPHHDPRHHDPRRHDHSHAPGFPRRALVVGMVHGVAGSAALLLLTVGAVGSVWLGLAYIALFGAGSILGMALLSTAIAVPLQAGARWLTGAFRLLEGSVAVTTIGVGLWMLWTVGRGLVG